MKSETSARPVDLATRMADGFRYIIHNTEVALPRSVPGIIYGLQHYSDVDSSMLEWHGHNDFYKADTPGRHSRTTWPELYIHPFGQC